MTESVRLPKGPLFGIDMARCVGCYTCAVACKDRAGLPDVVDWLRVERHEGGRYPDVRLAFRVVHCYHCAQAPCADACPVGAITHAPGGMVATDGDACSGCGACVDACPFGAVVMEGASPTRCDGCGDEVAGGIDPTCVRACPMRALFYGRPESLGRPRVSDPSWDDAGTGARVWYGVRPEQGAGHG
jgi:anaerobic dimethyl sulfoxide reductase subunit B (iron-sulfur subunit)